MLWGVQGLPDSGSAQTGERPHDGHIYELRGRNGVARGINMRDVRPKEVAGSQITHKKEREKGSIGSYIRDVVLSMLFPILALVHRPLYVLKGQYVKALLLILIVAVELIIVWSVLLA
jgi:hypothetical protein